MIVLKENIISYMNKKYYKLNEDRWELPDFDEYIGQKWIGQGHGFDPNHSPLEWEDFDNSEINWSGMSYRTKEERKRDDKIISELRNFYNDTKSIRVTGEDKLEEGEYYCRLSFPRWSTKTKKHYKNIFENYFKNYYKNFEIDLNKDNTDEIRRLIKYYPEYNPSKYLFLYDLDGCFDNKLNILTVSLSCIIEGLLMDYFNGKELTPENKIIWWNNKKLNTFGYITLKK